MRSLMTLAVVYGFVAFALGCGGGSDGGAGAGSTGGGRNFEAAMAACRRLGIEVRSTRPGKIINGVLPEASASGPILVNMTFSGGRMKIEFYNTPKTPGWEATWRKKIINAVKRSG